DGITKKIESYQQRLESPETSPEEREKFTNLISVLTAARNYQYSIITHLANSPTSPDPKIESLQRLSRISVAMKLNERPNKIELIAEKLEKDYSQLATYQERVQALQSKIEIAQQVAAAIGGQIREDDPRLRSRAHLLNAITHQFDLIEARVASTTVLRPPYETLSEDQQANLSANKWLCIKKEALAQSEELLAQASLLHIQFHRFRVLSLNGAAKAFQSVAEEAQKPNPNQQIIDWFTKSASLHQQAAEAEAEGLNKKAEYLCNAGTALFSAATEAQKPEPKQQSIDWFTQSASLYQQAAEAEAEGLNKKAEYLCNAGAALYKAAQEAQKPEPKPQSIDWFTQSAILHQQAAEAEAAGLNKKAGYLCNAGWTFHNMAQEVQKPEPNQQCIDWLT
ncbi:MAG: hypothetical protein QE493_00220, partial [Verrucomicrobiae bacterium]|nr:hypothetical protein [Verrucomicrobiae bacterium]